MNKILVTIFSAILPRIMAFLNKHGEEMLDDILNRFYANFKEVVNSEKTLKDYKLEVKIPEGTPKDEKAIIENYLKQQQEEKEKEIIERFLKQQELENKRRAFIEKSLTKAVNEDLKKNKDIKDFYMDLKQMEIFIHEIILDKTSVDKYIS